MRKWEKSWQVGSYLKSSKCAPCHTMSVAQHRCRQRDTFSCSVTSVYSRTQIRARLNFPYSGWSSAAGSSMAYQGQECVGQHLQAFISVLSHTQQLKTAGMLTRLQINTCCCCCTILLFSSKAMSESYSQFL